MLMGLSLLQNAEVCDAAAGSAVLEISLTNDFLMSGWRIIVSPTLDPGGMEPVFRKCLDGALPVYIYVLSGRTLSDLVSRRVREPFKLPGVPRGENELSTLFSSKNIPLSESDFFRKFSNSSHRSRCAGGHRTSGQNVASTLTAFPVIQVQRNTTQSI